MWHRDVKWEDACVCTYRLPATFNLWKNGISTKHSEMRYAYILGFIFSSFSSVQSLSRVRLFATPITFSTPGLPVHYQLPESTQAHVHWVGDAIQPTHPLLSLSPLALNLPQNRSFPMSQLFASGGQSIGVSASTSVLPMNTQDWSPLGWTGWISLQSRGLSRVFSNTTVQKHEFFCTQLS